MAFMGMHIRYSIDLCHLMQRGMHSRKPGVGEIITTLRKTPVELARLRDISNNGFDFKR